MIKKIKEERALQIKRQIKFRVRKLGILMLEDLKPQLQIHAGLISRIISRFLHIIYLIAE